MKTLRTTLAGAGLAMLLLVSCSGGDGDADTSGAGFDESASTGSVARDAPASGDGNLSAGSNAGSAAGEVGASEQVAQLTDRKIILTSHLRLEVDDVPGTFRDVQAKLQPLGGYVESSRLEYDEDAGPNGKQAAYAALTVRIPAERHDELLTALRGLPAATVTSETTDSQQVTAEYTDLQSQLRNLQRIETQYLALLEQADGIDDILTVSDRLDGVRAQIEQTQGRINVLDNLTELATVTITISPAVPGSDGGSGDSRSPKTVFLDAWNTSLDVGESVLYGAIVAGVTLLWLMPLGAVAAVIWVAWRRRVRADVTGTGSDAGVTS